MSSNPTHPGQFPHDLSSTTFTDREQQLVVQQPRHHQCIFKQTTHHASHLQLRMQLAETQTT